MGPGTGEVEVKGEQYLPRLLSRSSAAEITPIKGTSSMPVEADDGGRRRRVSNQVR